MAISSRFVQRAELIGGPDYFDGHIQKLRTNPAYEFTTWTNISVAQPARSRRLANLFPLAQRTGKSSWPRRRRFSNAILASAVEELAAVRS